MKRHSVRFLLAIALAAGVSLTSGSRPARAEEGGSGHYFPGSMASFVDGVAPKPAVIIRYNMAYYDGSIGANFSLPIGGTTAAGVDATSWAHALTFFWRPPIEIGERWSYGMSATIPYISLDVSASAIAAAPGGGPPSAGRTDSVSGIGDIVLQPFMMNYNVNPDINVNYRVTLYAPTGSYEVGRLANTGKNFWTVEPTVGFMYFGTKNGRELSVFTGLDFNSENEDTSYKSGTQFHLDGTFAQHLPLWGGLAGFGVSSFYYQQIEGDSGSGANFGDFKATTAGVGPVISYTTKLGDQDLLAELKWLREYHTKNRLEGDTIFFKLIVKF